MLGLIHAATIADLHLHWTNRWHDPALPQEPRRDPLEELIREQHRANFELWHEEDRARIPDAPDAQIAAVKRQIDALNQRRNDLVERIDAEMLERLPPMALTVPLHSETPGMMIDRLSILALKIFHTEEETRRVAAGKEHTTRNAARLQTLREQHTDLTGALSSLLSECSAGTRRFKLYKQLKMYNDPELNPAVYGASK